MRPGEAQSAGRGRVCGDRSSLLHLLAPFPMPTLRYMGRKGLTAVDTVVIAYIALRGGFPVKRIAGVPWTIKLSAGLCDRQDDRIGIVMSNLVRNGSKLLELIHPKYLRVKVLRSCIRCRLRAGDDQSPPPLLINQQRNTESPPAQNSQSHVFLVSIPPADSSRRRSSLRGV